MPLFSASFYKLLRYNLPQDVVITNLWVFPSKYPPTKLVNQKSLGYQGLWGIKVSTVLTCPAFRSPDTPLAVLTLSEGSMSRLTQSQLENDERTQSSQEFGPGNQMPSIAPGVVSQIARQLSSLERPSRRE